MKSLPFRMPQKFLVVLSLFFSFTLIAQSGWNPERVKESKETLKQMVEDTPKLKTFKNKAYGYAVFSKVTKAGIGIGGAAGRGTVFRNHKDTGWAALKQASIGLQLGGQQYSEVIFFENKKAYDHFINGNLKFDAQASAVAITAGASIDAAYHNGVAVFTRAKGGLMYEASIGGQHFKFHSNKEK
jgi:lipid-binding SYLF domain-containing protein